MDNNKIKLAIVDDHHLFRKGLISLLSEFPEVEVVIEASGARNLIAQLEKKTADILIMDIQMPETNGTRLAKILRETHPELKILVLTMLHDEDMVLHLLDHGVRGVLLKECEITEVVNAVHSIMSKGYYFNEVVSGNMVDAIVNKKNLKEQLRRSDLSEREIEIIRLICKEYTNKEIAEKLHISSRTVDGHRENILRKTDSKNVAGIIMYAMRNGIIQQ